MRGRSVQRVISELQAWVKHSVELADAELARPASHRFKLWNVPNRPGKEYYPSLDLLPRKSEFETDLLDHTVMSVKIEGDAFDAAGKDDHVWSRYFFADAEQIKLATPGIVPGSNLRLAIFRLGGLSLSTPKKADSRAIP